MRCSLILKNHALLDRPKEHLIYPFEKEEVRFLSSVDGKLRELEELVLSLYVMDREYPEENSLILEVCNTKTWTELKGVIETLFSFLTDRYLSLRFEKAQSPKSLQSTLFNTSPIFFKKPTLTCLFSGGLDSTAGVLNLQQTEEPLLHHTITGKVVKGKVCDLHKSPTLNKHGLALTDSQLRYVRPGRSSLRGFLFLTNASIIANSFGHRTIVMPENGPLMINPQVSLLSPQPTRNAHPFLVKSFEQILSRLTGKEFTVKSIFKEKTKAEIFASVITQTGLINKTYSCFTVQGQKKMCGICYACFVRRASALCVDYQEPKTIYSMDPFTVDIGKLGNISVQKINILKDSLSLFRNVLFNDELVDQLLEDVPKGFFSNGRDLLRRFAEDLFLGTKNYLMGKDPSLLNAFGKFAAEMISAKIDESILIERREQLLKQADF
jgi:7-cyano-7-deazaguanine synthase in queuosine biosynthesis